MHVSQGYTSMTDLSVVIVTWNSEWDLERCLPSLQTAAQGLAMEVVVVDNASTDGSVDAVGRYLPGATVIVNAVNKGFAVANNQAFAMVKGRYLCLLNPDTVVTHDALGELCRYLDAHPSVWACGPDMRNEDGSPQRNGVRFPTLWNIFAEALFLDRLFPRSRLFGAHRELYVDHGVARPVDFLQGACLMVRSDVLKRVGGLDDAYFMYFEETDWCYRIKKAGGEVHYCPDGTVVHFGGGSFAHYDEHRLFHYHVSLLRFFMQHYGIPSQIALRALLMLRSGIRVLVWSGVLLIRPSARPECLSTLKGYFRVARLLVFGGS